MNRKTTIALIGVASLLFSGLAQASALIRITPIGVAVDEQTDTGPVPIQANDDGFRLSYWGNGNQGDLLDPLLVILATPEGFTPTLDDGPGTSGPTATVSTSDTGYYGGSWGSDGSVGVFNETTAGNGSIYDFVGLYYKANGNASNNYTNWSGASGLTSWDIWVFQVAFDPGFGQGDWNEFTSSLVAGSFIVGYGCTGAEVITAACDGQGKSKHTPFTFTGYVVPEPGTVGMLGLGLVAIGLLRRRRIG